VPGCYVTLPTATAQATIDLVEDLETLQLNLAMHAHRFPDQPDDSPLVVSVLTQIVDRGYAVHGDY